MEVTWNGSKWMEANGWKHVSYCGSCFIYARGNKRRLVDPKSGKSTFEYIMENSEIGHSENINKGVCVSPAVEGDNNARL